MKTAISKAAWLLAAALVQPVWSQELSLAEVWHRAAGHDYAWQAAEQAHLASAAKREQAQAVWRPSVVAGGTAGIGSASTHTSGAQFSTPSFGTQSGVNFNTSVNNGSVLRWQLGVQQPLYDRDKRAAGKQLRLAADMGDLGWEAAQSDLRLQLARQYFDLALAQQKVNLLQRQLVAVKRAQAEAKERFRVGEASIIDQREADAMLGGIQAELSAAKWQRDSQQRLLADRTGMPDIRVRFNPAQKDALRADGSQWSEQLLKQTNTRIALQQAAVRMAETEVDKNGPLAGSSVNLVAQAAGERISGSGDYGDATNKSRQNMIGIQVQVPLYAGGMFSAKRKEAGYQLGKAHAELADAEQTVGRQWRDLQTGLHADTERIAALRQALTASGLRLDATRVGREAGERTTLDVLNAENDYTAASLKLAQARADWVMHRLQQAAMVNRLDEELLNSLGLGGGLPEK